MSHTPDPRLSWLLVGLLAAQPSLADQSACLPPEAVSADARRLLRLIQEGKRDKFREELGMITGSTCQVTVHNVILALGRSHYRDVIRHAQAKTRYSFEVDMATYVTELLGAVDDFKRFCSRFEGWEDEQPGSGVGEGDPATGLLRLVRSADCDPAGAQPEGGCAPVARSGV